MLHETRTSLSSCLAKNTSISFLTTNISRLEYHAQTLRKALAPYAGSLGFFIALEACLIGFLALKLWLFRAPPIHGSTPDSRAAISWSLFLALGALFIKRFIFNFGTGDVFFDHAVACNAATTVFVGFHFLIALPGSELKSSLGVEGKEEQQIASTGPSNIFECIGQAYRLRPESSLNPRPWRAYELPLSLLHAAMIYVGLNIMYDSYMVLSVGLGCTGVDEWPWLFGSPADAWSVKRFWGKVWHQLMRNHLTSTSTYIVESLPPPFRPASRRTKSPIQVTIIFLLSGLLHLAGEHHALRSLPGSDMSTSSILGGIFMTFALQPFGLFLEHLFCPVHRACLGHRMGPPSRLEKALGFLWVLAWFSFSMSFYTRRMMGAGFMTGWANIPRGWTLKAASFLLGI
ncbi:membrane bound O-acyl transferase family-domain-containing protein [Ephemerocybe angulata]|uniref:Membrane bound O-acyl transferase family-domain-containing protein n=1 Tax=Ephemerocybe angulata TaxID=980116 RepID=A0A8H6H8D5_9AGAR|nr:membrane bound O-acyl transferase family-domain-containing protein [Tulosesus angulatus]